MDMYDGEAWGVLTTIKFVTSLGLQNMFFEADNKCVIDKVGCNCG